MKRFFAILLVLLLLLCSSCGSDPGKSSAAAPLRLAPEAEQYLYEMIGVTKSAILACDFDAIRQYTAVKPISLSEVCVYLQKDLEDHFISEPVEDDAVIEEGMLVYLQIKTGTAGKLTVIEPNAFVMIGTDLCYKGLEEALLGHKKGDWVPFVLKEDGLGGLKAGQELTVQVQDLFLLSLKETILSEFYKEAGLATAPALFASDYNNAYARCLLEGNQNRKENVLEFALQHCTFQIDEEDLERAAQYFLHKTDRSAQALQMSLDEYGERYFDLGSDDVFTYLVRKTEEKLKEILFIGAAAVEGKMELTEEEYQAYCSARAYYPGRSTEAEDRYECLSNLVLGQLFSVPIVIAV